MAGQGTREDALNRRKLCLGDLSQRHTVKLHPKVVSDLGPEVSPVHVRLLALFLELGPGGMRASEHIAVSLFADNGDIPLYKQELNHFHQMHFRTTYLDNVERRTRLWGKRVLMAPRIRVAWLAIEALLRLGDIEQPGEIILHQGSKSGTGQGCVDKTSLELHVQVDVVATAIHLFEQDLEQSLGGNVHGMALTDSDAVGRIPWELLERANQALIRTLRAVLGIRRLERSAGFLRACRGLGTTYPVRHFHVLDEHNHLLLGHKAPKVLPGVALIERLEMRSSAIPNETAGKRE